MFEIVKHIDFCFGHRLMGYPGKCSQPHGHNGRVEVRLTSSTLDGIGMVADFRDVRHKVEAWIEANLDHRMVLQRDDPLIGAIEALDQWVYVIDEPPTTENLAMLIYANVQGMGFPVASVTLWETPDSYATFAPKAADTASSNGERAAERARA